jgi:hypothetical protein
MGTAVNEPGSWDNRKVRLQLRYPFLTENDLLLNDTNRNQMFDSLKSKLHLTSEELHNIIISL